MMKFTVKDVKSEVDYVIDCLQRTEWRYLLKQFPILLDDSMSVLDKRDLVENHSFSFANCLYIGFSESLCADFVNEYYEKKNVEPTWDDLERTVRSVLIHELGHILLGHVFTPPKQDKLDAEAQIVTNEIETNRGVDFDWTSDFVRDFCIHDGRDPFQTVKPLISYGAMYAEVKRILRKMKNNSQGSNGSGGQDQKQKEQQEAISRQVEMGKRSMNKIKDFETDVLTEMGLAQSSKFDEAKDPKEKLKILVDLAQNREIKKTLSKIKGTLAGELSKDKVGTYSRPSRKTGEDGLMKKGTKRAGNKRPNILIALDESGSMDTTAIKTAATAIELIAKTIGRNRSDITICKFNNSITGCAKMSNWKTVVNNYHPTGGTSFYSVCNKAVELDADVVVCIGDGEGYLPNDDIVTKSGKELRWIDVLIDPCGSVSHIEERYYGDIDRSTGRRETYWLGNDANKIQRATSDM